MTGVRLPMRSLEAASGSSRVATDFRRNWVLARFAPTCLLKLALLRLTRTSSGFPSALSKIQTIPFDGSGMPCATSNGAASDLGAVAAPADEGDCVAPVSCAAWAAATAQNKTAYTKYFRRRFMCDTGMQLVSIISHLYVRPSELS